MSSDRPELLSGNEAVALAAIHSGITGAFSYPGTPATEILEFVQVNNIQDAVCARWSANEKVAYEEALGMSFTGRRALVSMKHVGLNVAADPFMSSALTGARGGLVLAVADDPGMHSSQNEQDSRLYADFARIPVLEPGSPQEAYAMTREAFDLSERFGLPVMVRLVTRLSHGRSLVQSQPPSQHRSLSGKPDWREWTLLPPNARRRFRRLNRLQSTLLEYSQRSAFNALTLRGERGVIACGIANAYVNEALRRGSSRTILRLGAYPLPVHMIRMLVDHCSEILVVEEGYPFVERQLNGLLGVRGVAIQGKYSRALPMEGELTPDLVRSALGMEANPTPEPIHDLPPRPPRLCDGCPHCDTFRALVEAVKPWDSPILFSDIGCYTLGALPPFNAISSCVDMGASISMAVGAAKAGAHPVVCTIGDSTFTHSGMTGLIGAAQEGANITVVILDNASVAMTGGQDVFATGEKLVKLLKALGVSESHLLQIRPVAGRHDENATSIRREIEHRGLSVVVATRPCIHARRRRAQSVSITCAVENNAVG